MSVEELTAELNEAQLREDAEAYLDLMKVLDPIARGVDEGPAPTDNLGDFSDQKPNKSTSHPNRFKRYGGAAVASVVATGVLLAGALGSNSPFNNRGSDSDSELVLDNPVDPANISYLNTANAPLIVSVDESILPEGVPTVHHPEAQARDCIPDISKIIDFAAQTPDNKIAPPITGRTVEEVKPQLYNYACHDAKLMVLFGENAGIYSGLNDATRQELIDKLEGNGGAWQEDFKKLVGRMEQASKVTLKTVPRGTDYATQYILPDGTVVAGYEKTAEIDLRVIEFTLDDRTVTMILRCGGQIGPNISEAAPKAKQPTPTTARQPGTTVPVATTTPTTQPNTTTTQPNTTTTQPNTTTTQPNTTTTQPNTTTTQPNTTTTQPNTTTTQPNSTTTVTSKDAEPPVTGGPDTTVPPVTEAPQPTNVPTTEATVAPSTQPTDVRQRRRVAAQELSAEAKADIEAARKAAETSAATKAAAARQRTAQAAAQSTRRAGESAAQRTANQKQAQAAATQRKAAAAQKKAAVAKPKPTAKATAQKPAAKATPAAKSGNTPNKVSAQGEKKEPAKRKAIAERAASIVLPLFGLKRREEEVMELELINTEN